MRVIRWLGLSETCHAPDPPSFCSFNPNETIETCMRSTSHKWD